MWCPLFSPIVNHITIIPAFHPLERIFYQLVWLFFCLEIFRLSVHQGLPVLFLFMYKSDKKKTQTITKHKLYKLYRPCPLFEKSNNTVLLFLLVCTLSTLCASCIVQVWAQSTRIEQTRCRLCLNYRINFSF